MRRATPGSTPTPRSRHNLDVSEPDPPGDGPPPPGASGSFDVRISDPELGPIIVPAAAGPLPKVPAIVLSADKPWRVDLLPPEARQGEKVAFADWLESLNRLSTELDAEHVTTTNSGHDIYLYSPKLVIDAIGAVVDDTRSEAPR